MEIGRRQFLKGAVATAVAVACGPGREPQTGGRFSLSPDEHWIRDGRWHHIVLERRPDIQRVYIDGQLVLSGHHRIAALRELGNLFAVPARMLPKT